MNRRHLLVSTAALVVLTGAHGKMAALAAEPLSPSPAMDGPTLVGHDLNDLYDVLEGYVRLDRVQALYLPSTMTRSIVVGVMVRHASLPGQDTDRMVREYTATVNYLAHNRILRFEVARFPREERVAQRMAWEDAALGPPMHGAIVATVIE